MDDELFFDSYAIIEIIKGNIGYQRFSSMNIVTTKLNLFEVYYSMLRDYDENKAEKTLASYIKFVIDFDENVIREATKFRLDNKPKNLSMTDCIGYILAKKLGIKFLTGDEKFKDVENVEYVE